MQRFIPCATGRLPRAVINGTVKCARHEVGSPVSSPTLLESLGSRGKWDERRPMTLSDHEMDGHDRIIDTFLSLAPKHLYYCHQMTLVHGLLDHGQDSQWNVEFLFCFNLESPCFC